MALIQCPECGKQISSNAVTCPNCGNPVPKKMCPVHIERNSTIAVAIICYVYFDGTMYGELKGGRSLDLELPVGKHSVSVESEADVRFGLNSAATRNRSIEQFTINENTKSVSIVVKTPPSWFGGTGKCVIDSIQVR